MSAETRGAAVDAEVRGIQRGGTIGTRGVRRVYLGVGSSWSQGVYGFTIGLDLHGHLLKYEWNFAGGGGQSLLWLEGTTFLNYIDIHLSDHLLKYGWNFADEGGNSLL